MIQGIGVGYDSSPQSLASQLRQQYNAMPIAEWMIAGRVMSFDEFVNELFPTDCPERTYLILKYKGE